MALGEADPPEWLVGGLCIVALGASLVAVGFFHRALERTEEHLNRALSLLERLPATDLSRVTLSVAEAGGQTEFASTYAAYERPVAIKAAAREQRSEERRGGKECGR